MAIPIITGPEMLSAVKEATRDLPDGAPFAISLLDSYDLCKLTVDQLVAGFDFGQRVAERIVDRLNHHDLSELGKALGLDLIIDQDKRTSLMPNAGLIRSAGAWGAILASLPTRMKSSMRFGKCELSAPATNAISAGLA